MLPAWAIFALALFYIALLFGVATYGDRRSGGRRASRHGRPVIYALSLAIYCTSWTYFGSVGLASHRGLEFLGIYIGPVLMFTVGMPVIRRIVALAKTERLTSIADFIAARYGKNPTVAGIVALIAVIGVLPYIALQLKAISSSVATLVSAQGSLAADPGKSFLTDIALPVTIGLAIFAVIFGTRHTDATEHQDGLILAVAAESVVKLLAITTVGLFVVFGLFDGPLDLIEQAARNPNVIAAMTFDTPVARWIVMTALSAFAIIMLPRQFHVTIVENRSPDELKTARFMFPAYLVAINLFVVPLAIGGIVQFSGGGDADLYVLSLPIAHDMPGVTVLAFIGGFSAATAMVIVASVAISIMISNDIVMPVLLRRNNRRHNPAQGDFGATILMVRRSAIFVILLLGYAYYRAADATAGLASIGLLSFAAIGQLAPSLFGGLLWRNANARGAIVGMTSGILVWAAFLFLPSVGGPDLSVAVARAMDAVLPGPDFFSTTHSDNLVNITMLSLAMNTLLFVAGSMSRRPRALERVQAGVFIPQRVLSGPLTGRWQTKVSVADLQQTVSRYLGAERTERSFRTFQENAGRTLSPLEPADMVLVRFAEQLLGSAIGSASARLVLSLLFKKNDDASAETARLLDEASEALQYNRDVLQSALAQMDQGITVFDRENRLTIWNRRFRHLLDLPETVGQVGTPLDTILSLLRERGDLNEAGVERFRRDFLTMDEAFTLTVRGGERIRIIEVRSNPMPDSGVVTTYADVTDRVAADNALKQANETLEARVAERTAELTRVNRELGRAQAAAEEANLSKTRFLAAAGHDILQPLNAARLYSSSLVERLGDSENRELVRNIDSSLESVEAILGAVLDISRLDTGAMKPQISSFPLNDLLRRVATDFAPVAREKSLRFSVMPTSLYVRSDPNLLRRLVQNLVSNAIKYTPEGRVLIGARRLGKTVQIQVIDTGIGIPSTKFGTVFKEFARLEEGARAASGLGLGLSIVDRIARVLNHKVILDSRAGKGTDFRVEVPLETNIKRMQAARPAAPSAPAVSALGGLFVVFVDNEPRILEGMALLLSGWGCRVRTLSSVAAARAMANEDQAAPDAIIVDYHLDDGTGIEVVRLLRARFEADIPAVVVTADRTQEVRTEAEALSISVQHKPIRPASLRAYLNQVAVSRRKAAE